MLLIITCYTDYIYGLQYRPAHEILVLIAYRLVPLINAHVGKTSKARGLNFVLRLHQHPYTLCMPVMKAMLSLSICTNLREPLMLPDAISA